MSKYKQDMPPAGGFGEINYKAVPTKRWISNYKLAATVSLLMVYGGLHNRQVKRKWRYDEINEFDAKIAIEPFFEAERDRRFLKVLWNNREMEKKIMKDVKGWTTGTFYGIPYFRTLDKDSLIPECMATFNTYSLDLSARRVDPMKQGLSEFRLK